jgi:sugar phosphate isomerase/epimerase
MSGMILSGAAWSFVGTSLAESAAVWRALGVSALELIAYPGGTLDTRAIEADPAGQAGQLRALGVQFSGLLYNFGASFEDQPLNSPDPGVRVNNIRRCRRVLELCAAAGLPTLTVLPGVDAPGLPHADALHLAGEVLTDLSHQAAAIGVRLVFEPHIGSVLELPGETLAFLQANPGLRIVLDYSHFIVQGYTVRDVDVLLPYVGHVHLRQCAPGQIQARWDAGVVDFAAAVGRLKQAGYAGFLTIEYEHEAWMNMDRVDVMTETIEMRNRVGPCL